MVRVVYMTESYFESSNQHIQVDLGDNKETRK